MERWQLGRLAMFALCTPWITTAAAQDGGVPTGDDDPVCADDDDHFDDDDDLDDLDDDDRRVVAHLRSVCEVPSISSSAHGTFNAEIDDAGQMIVWTLTYQDLEAPVEQAHIHFGERHTNGGISAFFCTNLGNGPPGAQPCPDTTATLNGTITPEQIIGPADQGIAAGEFEELVRAIRSGAAYVNVHTTTFPAGEIRGQVVDDDDDDDLSAGQGLWDY